MTNISETAYVIGSRTKKLLVVDDSDFIRERVVSLFNEEEIFDEVLQAKNSAEAYEVFNSSIPDIVILDIHIPGDNGIKVLETIKKKRPSVKVLILTNYPYEQYRKKCMELGADYFLQKSGEMDKLTEVVENMLVNTKKAPL